MKFLVVVVGTDNESQAIGEIDVESAHLTKEAFLDILAEKNLLKEVEAHFITLASLAAPNEAEEGPSFPIDWSRSLTSEGEWGMWMDGMETKPFRPLTLFLPKEDGGATLSSLGIVPKGVQMGRSRTVQG